MLIRHLVPHLPGWKNASLPPVAQISMIVFTLMCLLSGLGCWRKINQNIVVFQTFFRLLGDQLLQEVWKQTNSKLGERIDIMRKSSNKLSRELRTFQHYYEGRHR